MENALLDTLENGIFITNANLDILFWNNWLVSRTNINKAEAESSTLVILYPDISFTILKRKIRIALKMQSSTFTSSTVEQYVIPIRLSKVTGSIFTNMRQDVIITPLDHQRVSVVIYDATPLLEAQAVIDRQLQELERQARTDALTGCYNRGMFNELLRQEIKKANRYRKHFSIIIYDIDNFKKVNDTYGHAEGDYVLTELARISRLSIRESDILCRWGGEEFCVLLPETDLNGACLLGDKIRSVIEKHDFGISGFQHCSFGVCSYEFNTSESALFNHADLALYFAKNSGKNQVAFFKDGDLFPSMPKR